jgi:PPOX class probable F420-dependent enzyme
LFVMIPTSHADLVEGPIVVALVTMMPDGQPQATAVWLLYDGTHLLVVTGRDRQKYRNMKERPLVTIMALDPKNPGRYLEIRGKVEEITAEGAIPTLDIMAQLYEGTPKYYGYLEPAEDEGKQPLVLCKIRPTKVVVVG